MNEVTITITVEDGKFTAVSNKPKVVEVAPKWAYSPLDIQTHAPCKVTWEFSNENWAFAAPNQKAAFEIVNGPACGNYSKVKTLQPNKYGYPTQLTYINDCETTSWIKFNLNVVCIQEINKEIVATFITIDPGDTSDSAPPPPPPPIWP